jgi:hypothetical protein
MATICNTAVRMDVIAKSPCRVEGGATQASVKRPVITRDELQRAVDSVPDRYRAALSLAAWCQLRRSEVLGLLDAFAGNMLTEGSVVSAVHHIGGTAQARDGARLPVRSGDHPSATARDFEVAMSWLRQAELAQWFDPVILNTGRYAVMGADDVSPHAWGRSVSLSPGHSSSD